MRNATRCILCRKETDRIAIFLPSNPLVFRLPRWGRVLYFLCPDCWRAGDLAKIEQTLLAKIVGGLS